MAAKKRHRGNDALVVKTSILIGVRDHALWSACASLRGIDRSAFAVEAIRQACSGLILVDRRAKPKDQVKLGDRLDVEPRVSPDADDAA
jgi:hypothetical protein